MNRLCVFVICFFVILSSTRAQQGGSSTSSPSAPTDPILQVPYPSAVTITASAEQTLGSKHHSGSIVFKTSSDGSYSEQWSMASGQTEFQASAPDLARACSRTGITGAAVAVSHLSCLRSVPWFAPWVGAQLSATNLVGVVAASATAETAEGPGRVFQLPTPDVSQRKRQHQKAIAAAQAASAVTVYYDPITFLPTKSVYLSPLEDGSNIEIAVAYSDYRDEGGYMLPHHLVRTIQHTVELELSVSSVTVN